MLKEVKAWGFSVPWVNPGTQSQVCGHIYMQT